MPGQHDVDQHDVGRVAVERLEGVLAVVGLLDDPALVLEGHLDRGADAFVVFDGQDAGSHRPMVPDRRAGNGRYPRNSSTRSVGPGAAEQRADERARAAPGGAASTRQAATAVRRARFCTTAPGLAGDQRRRRPCPTAARPSSYVGVDPAAGHRAQVERRPTRPGGCRGRGRSRRRSRRPGGPAGRGRRRSRWPAAPGRGRSPVEHRIGLTVAGAAPAAGGTEHVVEQRVDHHAGEQLARCTPSSTVAGSMRSAAIETEKPGWR